VPERTSNRRRAQSLTDNTSRNPLFSESPGERSAAPPTSQADSPRSARLGAAVGMPVEIWVASPEPAVRVFTPAGTCPGRLWRHCVIGCADPGQNPSAVRSGSSRVRGRGLGRAARGLLAARSPAAVMRPGRKGSGHRCAISVPLATVSSGKLRRPMVSQIGRSYGNTGLY
jgi:hypothetical protein